MTEFLLSLIPTCLLIWAVHILFQEGHLLEKQGEWITNKVGEKWAKPLINCPICQSSVWGLIGFFSLPLFGVYLPVKLLLPYIFSLCGLNTILSKLISKERIIVDE